MTSLLCRSLVRNLVITVPQETPAVYFIQCRGKRKGPPGAKTYAYDLKQPELPEPSHAFRRRVHFPEEYTVKPLSVTRLGGRDPVSGSYGVIYTWIICTPIIMHNCTVRRTP